MYRNSLLKMAILAMLVTGLAATGQSQELPENLANSAGLYEGCELLAGNIRNDGTETATMHCGAASGPELYDHYSGELVRSGYTLSNASSYEGGLENGFSLHFENESFTGLAEFGRQGEVFKGIVQLRPKE